MSPRPKNEITKEEEALIAKVKEGDEYAFSKLMANYKQRIYGCCFRRLRDEESAEEAAIEIFTKAFFNIGQLKENKKFISWLFTIAYHHCMDRLKKKRGKEERGEDLLVEDFPDPPSQGPSPEDRILEQEKQNIVQRIVQREINNLKPRYREIILLIHYDHLSLQEAAEVLHIGINAAKTRKHRAIEKLNENLKPFQEILRT